MNGQQIDIANDNGVSLWIDGTRIPGFSERAGTVALEAYTFPGLTGAHKIELIFENACGPGFLSFSPEM